MLLRSSSWLLAAVLFGACAQPDAPLGMAAAANAAPAASQPPATTTTTPPTPAAMPTPELPKPTGTAPTEVATFGGGCFWCTEAILETLDGVRDVVSGYTGGAIEDPSYEQICTGTTGHAEVVQVTFDPQRISYAKLLEWFFKLHDPTTLNQQGPDHGTQYRSAIFFHSPEQQQQAQTTIAALQPKFGGRIVTEVTAAVRFWPAEEYHQDYFRKNPNNRYCSAMIPPKLKKLGLDAKK